jgi:hypothetical protein
MSPPLSMIGMSGPVSSFTSGESGPTFDFLLVGGGGRGGRSAGGTTAIAASGGGGAGGVLVVNNEVIALNQVIYCEVAATGTDNFGPGNNTYLRQNTSGGTILHYIKGGGKGSSDGYTSSTNAAGYNANPFGASGGGGSGWQNTSGASSGSYGNGGGDGGSNQGGGGGGGFGSAGEDNQWANGPIPARGGNGGSGYSLSNFFSELTGTIAGGGGGAGANTRTQSGDISANAGTGSSGGGSGGYQGSDGGNATDNTGSGGGGASPSYSGSWPSHSSVAQAGGTGGSGVIYLKYIADNPLFSYSGTQTVNNYTVSSITYQIHKITTSGSLTRTS